MASPLLVVTLVLRYHKEGAALEHVGRLIASYVGPKSDLTLRDACEFGSTELLDWKWAILYL